MNKISVFILILFPVFLFSEAIPDLILKAATIFQQEKNAINNYKSFQKLNTKIKDNSGIVIEKRDQVGIFTANGDYTFLTKYLEINGTAQILNKEIIERFQKKEIDWLSTSGLENHKFQLLDTDGQIQKFLVNPKTISNQSYRGQIWIHTNSNRIFKIIKEPIIKKKDVNKYVIELRFEKKFTYQFPSNTKMIASYQNSKGLTDVEIDIIYEDYQFNLKSLPEINK